MGVNEEVHLRGSGSDSFPRRCHCTSSHDVSCHDVTCRDVSFYVSCHSVSCHDVSCHNTLNTSNNQRKINFKTSQLPDVSKRDIQAGRRTTFATKFEVSRDSDGKVNKDRRKAFLATKYVGQWKRGVGKKRNSVSQKRRKSTGSQFNSKSISQYPKSNSRSTDSVTRERERSAILSMSEAGQKRRYKYKKRFFEKGEFGKKFTEKRMKMLKKTARSSIGSAGRLGYFPSSGLTALASVALAFSILGLIIAILEIQCTKGYKMYGLEFLALGLSVASLVLARRKPICVLAIILSGAFGLVIALIVSGWHLASFVKCSRTE